MRTLRYYDQVGLLTPARSAAGYRLYGAADLMRLQQILALRFLGFSLEEIGACLATAPAGLAPALTQQKAMLQEWRTRLETVVRAIEGAEHALQAGCRDWDAVVDVIRAMQMEEQQDWRNKHLTKEQQQALDGLIKQSYSESALAKLTERNAARGGWTEEDQRQASARYDALFAGVRRLVAAGADPTGAEAQALAREAIALEEAFTGGDPELAAGLRRYHEQVAALPAAQRPFPMPLTPEEGTFLDDAKRLARQGA